MADDAVAPRARAAKLSRRSVLTGMASAPIALQLPEVVASSLWDQALTAYLSARRTSEEFVTGVLKPAYRKLNAGLERAGIAPKSLGAGRIRRLRERVTKAEEELSANRRREDVLAFRRTHADHRAYRNLLARERLAERARRKALIEHRIFDLEEHGNELAATRCDRFRTLILVPSKDVEALRLKIRLAYEEFYRFEDDEGLFRIIAADSETLLRSAL